MKTAAGTQFTPQRVLAIGAHADDIDFAAAGSLAVWAKAGAEIEYLVITDGCKGAKVQNVSRESIAEVRKQEQRNAAKVVSASDVHFLDYEDSALEVTQGLKKDLVRHIRRFAPDTVIVNDPSVLYSSELGMINHSDHRAAGQATLDAVYPLARDHLTYPDLLEEGLHPHKVAHVLLTTFEKQNCFIDISETFDLKLAALDCHVSQFPDTKQTHAMAKKLAEKAGQAAGTRYAEGFIRIDIHP